MTGLPFVKFSCNLSVTISESNISLLQCFVLLHFFSVTNQLHSVLLIFQLRCLYSELIKLLILNLYSSFTLDFFTLLVVLPKNKIRSFINSFKFLYTEQPRLLIFLYCSPENFSFKSKTLLFNHLLLETNSSKVLLFFEFPFPATRLSCF